MNDVISRYNEEMNNAINFVTSKLLQSLDTEDIVTQFINKTDNNEFYMHETRRTLVRFFMKRTQVFMDCTYELDIGINMICLRDLVCDILKTYNCSTNIKEIIHSKVENSRIFQDSLFNNITDTLKPLIVEKFGNREYTVHVTGKYPSQVSVRISRTYYAS